MSYFGFGLIKSLPFWPTALKLDCTTNLDFIFLHVMGFISLVNEITFMLLRSGTFSYCGCGWADNHGHTTPILPLEFRTTIAKYCGV